MLAVVPLFYRELSDDSSNSTSSLCLTSPIPMTSYVMLFVSIAISVGLDWFDSDRQLYVAT